MEEGTAGVNSFHISKLTRSNGDSNQCRGGLKSRLYGGRHCATQRRQWTNPYALKEWLILKGVQHLFLSGLAGIHPLRGPNAEEFGPRFPPLSDAYDLDLRRHVHKAWAAMDLSGNKRRLHEGIYAFVGGPR